MDTIALVGRVITVSGSADAAAVLVRDGRIEAVGGEDVVAHARSIGVQVRDVGDRVILPGFVDPHVHFEHYAVGRGRAVDCRVPGCLTISDVLDNLHAGLGKAADSGWLIGYGNLFFDQKLAERRLPTRHELDKVSDRIPIVLHCGGHTSVLNTRALELAGVERFLGGGAEGLWGSPVVEVDAQGAPTGVVGEIDGLLPIPPLPPDEVRAHMESAYRDLFTRYGVTTFGEMVGSLASVDILDELISSARIPARAVMYGMVPSILPLDEACEWAASYRSRAGRDLLSAAGVKLFADGGYSSRNAASRTPYVREHAPRAGYAGQLNMTQAAILDAVHASRRHDVQLAVHANGTRAQDEIIAALLSLANPHDHRAVRIEHAGNILGSRADLVQWRRANVIPIVQPGFLYNFVGDFVPMLEDGIVPVASTDVGLGAEEEQSNPLFSIWECAARRGYWGRVIEEEESIGFAQALRLHTLEAARALGIDDKVGSVEPGKYGDLVVLDRDPRRVPLDELRQIQVDSVYLAGREVHHRDGSQ
jgi:predicted amidohydrolase YtcJ